MSSTEEIAKSMASKLSPFGNPISKKLLTPCRQVGLSRKRKTPNSITNVFLASPTVTNTPENSNTTPLNHKKTVSKVETRSLSFNSPNTKLAENSTPLNYKKTSSKTQIRTLTFDSPVTDDKEITKEIVKDNLNKSAKKTLVQTFSSDLFNESKKTSESTSGGQDLASALQVDEALIDDYSQTLIKDISVLPKVASNITYDSDDDFKIIDKTINKARTKQKTSTVQEPKRKSKSFRTKSSDNADGLKMCQISIQKLSEEEIDVNISKPNVQKGKIEPTYVSDDDDFVVVKRKKVGVFVSDDSDFQSTPSETENLNVVKIKTQAIVHNSDDVQLSVNDKIVNNLDGKTLDNILEEKENKFLKSNTMTEKHSRTKIINSVKSTDKKILNILDDEDDYFTSTPEREKNEKLQLIEKIKSFENKVKQKRKKLEELQQAAIYKSKHNVEELRSLTETWRQGCILGLNGLLSNLQQYGPIDMITLLHNLHIPLDIAKSKIKLALET